MTYLPKETDLCMNLTEQKLPYPFVVVEKRVVDDVYSKKPFDPYTWFYRVSC